MCIPTSRCLLSRATSLTYFVLYSCHDVTLNFVCGSKYFRCLYAHSHSYSLLKKKTKMAEQLWIQPLDNQTKSYNWLC